MAARKLRNAWWVDFRAAHVRYRRRSPENTRVGAQAYESVLRQRLARGQPIDTNSEQSISFAEFAWRWFEKYAIPNNRPSEQYRKRRALRSSIVPFFGQIRLDAITTYHVEQFKAAQSASGISNKAINNKLTVLGRCLRSAHEWHGTSLPLIKLLRCPPSKTTYLTATECGLLLDRTSGQMREMILIALRTGMRQGEIRGLQWSSIDWENRMIVVRHSLCSREQRLVPPKSNRERHIPLDRELGDTLMRRRRANGYVFMNWALGDPFTSHRMMDDLAGACAKAGVRRIGWHGLRHTFATQLTLSGVPLTVVKELLGHSSITTTMRYSHVAPSSLRTAIDMLSSTEDAHGQFWATGGQRAASEHGEDPRSHAGTR